MALLIDDIMSDEFDISSISKDNYNENDQTEGERWNKFMVS